MKFLLTLNFKTVKKINECKIYTTKFYYVRFSFVVSSKYFIIAVILSPLSYLEGLISFKISEAFSRYIFPTVFHFNCPVDREHIYFISDGFKLIKTYFINHSLIYFGKFVICLQKKVCLAVSELSVKQVTLDDYPVKSSISLFSVYRLCQLTIFHPCQSFLVVVRVLND